MTGRAVLNELGDGVGPGRGVVPRALGGQGAEVRRVEVEVDRVGGRRAQGVHAGLPDLKRRDHKQLPICNLTCLVVVQSTDTHLLRHPGGQLVLDPFVVETL